MVDNLETLDDLEEEDIPWPDYLSRRRQADGDPYPANEPRGSEVQH